jgi:peptide deformylase
MVLRLCRIVAHRLYPTLIEHIGSFKTYILTLYKKRFISFFMTPYDIITIPDPVLKQLAQPIENITDALRLQFDRMIKTMYEAPGIGLAANQVGLLNRVIVMDLADIEEGEEPQPYFMANPEIIWESEQMSVMQEGCLSIPKLYADVERPAEVRVRYVDYHGKQAELSATGLLSHCVQHEIDHLNGVLFIDHISSLKRNMLLKKFDKMKKQGLL